MIQMSVLAGLNATGPPNCLDDGKALLKMSKKTTTNTGWVIYKTVTIFIRLDVHCAWTMNHEKLEKLLLSSLGRHFNG